jgi:hypothetical protein
MTDWEGEDRRKMIRRESDRAVCAFHDIKCKAISKNETHIEQLFERTATKEDLKEMREDIKSKAPRWVLIVLVGITITMFGWIATRIEEKFEWLYIVKANQEILLKIFHIEPIETVKEAKKEMKSENSK